MYMYTTLYDKQSYLLILLGNIYPMMVRYINLEKKSFDLVVCWKKVYTKFPMSIHTFFKPFDVFNSHIHTQHFNW